MVVASRIRPALFALAAALSLFAQVEAASPPSLYVSSCVAACIEKEFCATSDTKCMCLGAKLKLLDHVAVCMYYSCPNEIRSFDSSFITPLASACKGIGRAIPQPKIVEADETAQVFVDKLPPLSTSQSTSAKATPKTTTIAQTSSSQSKKTTAAATTSSKPAETTESSTSSSSVDDESTASTTTSTDSSSTTTTDGVPTTSTTLARATSSPTRAVTQSSTSTKGAPKSTDPADSSPFGTPQSAAGRSTTSWILTGLPLALAVMIR